MAGLFLDGVGAALGAGPEPLQGRSHVGRGLADDQGGRVEAEVVLGIGDRGAEHLGDRPGGAVGHELEHDQRVAVGATTDLIEHPADLGHGTADEAAVGESLGVGGVRCHRFSGLPSCL